MEDFFFQSGKYFIKIKDNEVRSNIPEHKLDDMFNQLDSLEQEYDIENKDRTELKKVIANYLVERGSLTKMDIHQKRKMNEIL